MSPIYNDNNFSRIELLLREKMFIKKIIKKKLGKKTIKCQTYRDSIGRGFQVKIDDASDAAPEQVSKEN
jgi:hypothetical protein